MDDSAHTARPAGGTGTIAALEGLRTALHRVDARTFAGYAVSDVDLGRRFVVELLIDGISVQFAEANAYHDALAGTGDGCYGFSFALPSDVLADAAVVETRLANTGTPVGEPILVATDRKEPTAPASGQVRWLGGLRFFGWIDRGDIGTAYVNALVDGELVAQARNWRWHHIGTSSDDPRSAPAFDLWLPTRFADGRVRKVHIVNETGDDLPGSPVRCVAFDQGLEQAIAKLGLIETEQLRGELFDHMVPNSFPLSDYPRWSRRFPPPEPENSGDPPSVAVVLVGNGEADATAQTLEQQTHARWVAAVLPTDEAGPAFDPSALRDFLEGDAAECSIVVFALAGVRFEAGAIARLASAFKDFPQASAVYGDLAVMGERNHPWLIALPAFDYERLLEQGYCALLFAAQRSGVARALAGGASSIFHVFNTLVEGPSASGSVLHVPGSLGTLPEFDRRAASNVLAAATADHLTRRGVDAEVAPSTGQIFPAVRVTRFIERPMVSIIIPTRNRLDLLRRCLETIAPAARRGPTEIIVVDNDSSDPETLDFLAAIDGHSATVVRAPGSFNFARLNNIALGYARGEFLCLLNNDIEATDELWLDEMASRLAEPDVGAVGALLTWPSGIVQHGGVVLGSELMAAHAFHDRMHDDLGYADLLRVAHECSAVTAACLLTRRTDYEEVGGLDEINFPVNFNDVDFCLKLRAIGKRIVFTPHARLLHRHSASRGYVRQGERAGRFDRELRALRARWLDVLIDDPFYSPLLSLDSIPFSALAWPPRSFAPRLARRPTPAEIPRGM